MSYFFYSLLFLSLFPGGLKIEDSASKTRIKVIKEVEREYYLLTKEKPLVFTVEGPLFVRVYLRGVLREETQEKVNFRLILEEDEERERVIRKETKPSDVAFWGEKKISKWTSFLLEVPPGTHLYKLFLWEGNIEEVLARPVVTSPPKWVEFLPKGQFNSIYCNEEERWVRYFEVPIGEEIGFLVQGPKRVKIVIRLNFDEKMSGEANFTLILKEEGKILDRAQFRTYKSEVARWREKKELIPSRKERYYLDVPLGLHKYSVQLRGIIAPSAGLRFLELKRR